MQIVYRKDRIFKPSDITTYIIVFLLAVFLYFWRYWFDYLNFQEHLALGGISVAIALIASKNMILHFYASWRSYFKYKQFIQLKYLDEAEKYILANWVFSGYSDFLWDFNNHPFRQKQKLVTMLKKFEQLGYLTHVHFYHIRGSTSLISCGFSLHDNNNLKLRKSLNSYRRIQ